jgi:hypothetical protein
MTRFAWPSYKEPWECIVTGVELDGSAGTLEINDDHFRVDAFDDTWSSAALSVEVSTHQSLPDGLAEPKVYVLVTCGATQLRRSYPLHTEMSESPTSFIGRIELPRTALSGKATLTAEVIGMYDGRARVVGSSVPWGLVVDKSEAPVKPGVPPLKTVWIDFADTDAPIEARRHVEGHAFVDVGSNPPVLYLNKGVDGLQLLILSNSVKLERRRHRDMLGASIARYVANALFRAAVEQISADDPEAPPEGPTTRVLRDICEAVASELPDTETVEDLYRAVVDLPPGTAQSASFWANVDLALDRLTSLSSTIARICEEAKRV